MKKEKGESEYSYTNPIATDGTLCLEFLDHRHEKEFLEKVARSKNLHEGLVSPATTKEAFKESLTRYDCKRNYSFVLRNLNTNSIVGIVNLNEVIKGAFNNAFLGYYAFHPYQGRGYIRAGIHLVLGYAKETIGLHRVEANIQPENQASIELVKRLGFIKEGYSKDYLMIGGKYRDHERWAKLL